MRFRVNSPKVIHQIFDTEVVIVNLETGIYYSVRGSGLDVWRALDAGFSPAEIVASFSAREGGALVQDFIKELERDQLIVEAGAGEPEKEGTFSPPATFAPPLLEKFTDMREMLLIDPIHELDEGGWPRRASAPETK